MTIFTVCFVSVLTPKTACYQSRCWTDL